MEHYLIFTIHKLFIVVIIVYRQSHHQAVPPNRPADPPPNVPRLRFSPEHSPR